MGSPPLALTSETRDRARRSGARRPDRSEPNTPTCTRCGAPTYRSVLATSRANVVGRLARWTPPSPLSDEHAAARRSTATSDAAIAIVASGPCSRIRTERTSRPVRSRPRDAAGTRRRSGGRRTCRTPARRARPGGRGSRARSGSAGARCRRPGARAGRPAAAATSPYVRELAVRDRDRGPRSTRPRERRGARTRSTGVCESARAPAK